MNALQEAGVGIEITQCLAEYWFTVDDPSASIRSSVLTE